MAQRLAFTLFLVASFLVGNLFTADFAFAQGIVTCGHGTSYDCGTCELIEMGNVFIDFVIRIMLVFVAIIFAYAGYRLVMSRGNTSEYEAAKRMLSNIIIGLIIMLVAWLMVDTVMRLLLRNSGQVQYDAGGSLFLPWNRIACTRNVEVADADPTIQGTTNYPRVTAAMLNQTVLTPGEISTAIAGASGMEESYMLCQIATSQGLGAYCDVLIAQMYVESRGNPNAISPAGAAGLMQLMPATARGLDPATLGGMSDAEVQQYLINNPEYNMTLGVTYFGQGLQATGGNINNTLAYYNGGPGALRDSRTCPGQTYWECTANEGYAETRNYVTNILGIAEGVQNPYATPVGAQ